MARSPFRGGETEAHRHSTAPIHASINLVSIFAVKVFMAAGGKHSGGDGFDVHFHVVKTRSARGTETSRGGCGEAGVRGEWAAESPALEQTATSPPLQVGALH